MIKTRIHKLLFLLGSILLVVVMASRTADPVQAQGRTGLVLAHYYAWFDTSSFNGGKTPFTHPNPYRSADAGTIQQHVSMAQGVGIDGFVQAWYGPDSSQQTEPNFATLLNTAGGSGFKAAVSFEPISGFMPNNDARANALSTLLATHAQHPAYLRMDGKPVVFFWANWALGVGDWQYIRDIADPNRNSIWIAEGGSMEYLSVFDGMYIYNLAWSPNPAGINLRWGGETRAASQTHGTYKYWVGTAMPGFNDSLLGRGDNTIVRDRADGAYYRSSFSGAAQSNPDLIVINSFNEWPEGSHIEPSNEFGDFYMTLTRELIGTYKSGGIPAAAPIPQVPANNNSGDGGAQTDSAQAEPQQVGTPLPTNTPRPTSTPQPTPTALPNGEIVYEIQSGDTLISVAIRFGVTLDELYENNNLEPTSLLSIGQPVVIGYDETIVQATTTAVAQLEPTNTPTPSVLDGYPNTDVRDDDGAIVYEVQEGNTIIEIALLYDLTLAEIYDLNDLSEDSLLSVGQEIVVGYVPTPSAENVGGSADLPQSAPTATPTVTPSPTATATTPPPTPTAQPTAVSALPTAVQPTAVPTAAVNAAQATGAASGGMGTWFLAILGGLVTLLLGMGGVLIYLGRRAS